MPPVPIHGTSPAFIGRAAELERLEEAFAEACAWRANGVLLRGEAGVGKSRLITELATRVRGRGACVLVGGAIDVGDGGLPYVPIIEALRPLADDAIRPQLLEALGPTIDELGPLLPGSGSAEASVTMVEGFAQAHLFERLLALFEGLGRIAPLVLMLEDLHWADRSTRDLLTYLVRNLASERILLIATYRTDELYPLHPLLPMVAELTRSRRMIALSLARFSHEEHAAHLTSLLGHEPPLVVVEATFARSEGNAFFTEELVADGDTSKGGELPATLREVLLARYRTCPADMRTMLRAASVGRTVTHPVLAEVSGLPETILLDTLRDGVERAIVVTDAESGRYGFRHALMAEAIYDDLLPGERSQLHAAFAVALSHSTLQAGASAPGAAAELAHHWLMAHNLDAALPAFVAAGRAARSVHAQPEALRDFETAIELAQGIPDAERLAGIDRPGLAELAAEAAEANGDFMRAVELWKLAIAQVDADDNPGRVALLWVKLGETHWLAGDLDSFVEARRKAVALTPPVPPASQRAHVLARLASALNLQSDLIGARRLATEAIGVARTIGSRIEEGRGLSAMGTSLYLAGDADLAVRYLVRALEISSANERIGEQEAVDRTNLSEALHLAGRLPDAIEVVHEGLQRVAVGGLERTYGETMNAVALELAYVSGDWDRAQRLADAINRSREGVAVLWMHLCAAAFESSRGNFATAEEHLAVVDAKAHGPRVLGSSGPHEQRALLALSRGRPSSALNEVETAIGLVDNAKVAPESQTRRWLLLLGLRAAGDLAELAHVRRDSRARATAATLGERLLDRFREHKVAVHSITRRPARHLFLDELLAEAEYARACRHHQSDQWEAVAAEFESLGHIPDSAYARFREAEARLLAGHRREGAAAPLHSAWQIAKQLGSIPLRNSVESLARRARIDLIDPETPNDDVSDLEVAPNSYRLTHREIEVVGMVANGRTNREIAEALFISDKTASVHVTNIKQKFGAANRVEIAVMAAQLGLQVDG